MGAVEIEEVAKLEKKLVHQEKVEASAVKRIQALEAEISLLKGDTYKIQDLEAKICMLKEETDKMKADNKKLTVEIETGRGEVERLEVDCSEERQMNAKLETELISIKGFNLEDLQVLLLS